MSRVFSEQSCAVSFVYETVTTRYSVFKERFTAGSRPAEKAVRAAPGGLDAAGHEATQRVGPQAPLFSHFELGPRNDPPGCEVLPAVGTFVAVEAPHALR